MNLLNENWQLIALLFGASGGGGWLGYILSRKSREIDVHSKAFHLNSEMFDSLREDYEQRVNYLQQYVTDLTGKLQGLSKLTIKVNELNEINKRLDVIIKEQEAVIQKQNRYLAIYRSKYGRLNENEINSITG